MKSLIIIWLISILVPASYCSTEHVDKLQSCLTQHNVNNFSTFPSTNYYELLASSIQNLRFADSSIQKPVAIIVPDSKEQIIDSVLCCRAGSWEIRVRSGGHSYEGSSYIVNDGSLFVVIDMMNLIQVSVDIESGTAWVESGATLGQTYYSISESSGVLGFTAGSCPTVGIGGHISGGGYGLISRKYGLAADNVDDALLIDAEGRLLDRQSMGEEVFWAIRGGGGGVWGIVYKWKLRLVKVPEIVTGFIVSRSGSKQHVLNLINQWQHIAPSLDGEFYLLAVIGAGLPEMKGTVGISVTFKGFYLGSKTKAVSMLERVFPGLGILEMECKEMTWIESILYFSGMSNTSSVADLKDRVLHQKSYYKAKFDYVRDPIPEMGLMSAIEMLEKQKKAYIVLDPYGGAMQKISSESIAFPHRKGNIYTIQYLIEWETEENAKDKEYMDWIRSLYNIMTPYVSSKPRATYINYMDFDLGTVEWSNSSTSVTDPVEMARIWGEKYFLKNYDRLVRAKTMIDPCTVFKNQQGIPPLSTACGRAFT